MKIISILSFLFSIIALSACNSATTVKPTINNTVGLPNACIEPSGQYQFIHGLVGSRQYNSERRFYSPVQGKKMKGIIKHDFNHDGRADYVFLERKASKQSARLIACISNNQKNYQRIKTAYIAREFTTRDNYVEYTSIIRKGDSLIIDNSNHAHNDGGEMRMALFTYNQHRKAFTLREYEYSSYGQAYPEIYQIFDMQGQRYSEEKGCTYAADSASISYDPDCKPRKIKQCLRSDKVIFITQQINREALKKRTYACRR